MWLFPGADLWTGVPYWDIRQEHRPRRAQRPETLTDPEATNTALTDKLRAPFPSQGPLQPLTAPQAAVPGPLTAPHSPSGRCGGGAGRGVAGGSTESSRLPPGSGVSRARRLRAPMEGSGDEEPGPEGPLQQLVKRQRKEKRELQGEGAVPGAGRGGLGEGWGGRRGHVGPVGLGEPSPLGSSTTSEGPWRSRGQPWQCPSRERRRAVARWGVRALRMGLLSPPCPALPSGLRLNAGPLA